jgi:thioredoxin-related protein
MSKKSRIGLAAAIVIVVVALVLLTGLKDAIGLTGSDALAWKGFGEAIKEAKQTNKKIVVDIYTNWCGWCKKMDKDVYSTKEVQSYLSENFIVVKLNAEASTKHEFDGSEKSETQIAKMFGVSSYPTTLFLTPQGELITSVPGYIKADMYVTILEYINGDHYKTTKWDEFLRSRQKK